MYMRVSRLWLIAFWFFCTPWISIVHAQSNNSSAPPSCTLSVSPQTIPQGDSARLSWSSSTGITSATISGVGPVASSGSVFVSPTQSVTFTGSFASPSGVANCSVELFVTASSNIVGGGTVGGGTTYTPPGTTPSPTTNISSPQTPGYSGTPTTGVPGYTPPTTPTTPTLDVSSLSYPGSTGNTNSSGNNTNSSGSGSSLVPTECQLGSQAIQCTLCDLEKLIQNIINFILTLSIPIAMLLFAIAGILYFTSAANPSNIGHAKKIFTSTFMGLLIAISGWLLVQTVMNVLVTGTSFTDWSWNNLQCSPNPYTPTTVSQWLNSVLSPPSATLNISTGGGIVPGTYTSGQETGSLQGQCPSAAPGNPTTEGFAGSAICNAAEAYIGQSTATCGSACAGTSANGTAEPAGNACAYAVNQVLSNAHLSAMGSLQVSDIQTALTTGGRGTVVSNQNNATCGDIVVSGGGEHVGVCLNQGCTMVISNSSSLSDFGWCSNGDFDGVYNSYGPSTIYQVNQ